MLGDIRAPVPVLRLAKVPILGRSPHILSRNACHTNSTQHLTLHLQIKSPESLKLFAYLGGRETVWRKNHLNKKRKKNWRATIEKTKKGAKSICKELSVYLFSVAINTLAEGVSVFRNFLCLANARLSSSFESTDPLYKFIEPLPFHCFSRNVFPGRIR